MTKPVAVGTSIAITNTDGSSASYPVKYVTGSNRVLIDMGAGTLAAADLTGDEGWQLSGTPTSPEEQAFIESQPGFGTTTTVVTKDP